MTDISFFNILSSWSLLGSHYRTKLYNVPSPPTSLSHGVIGCIYCCCDIPWSLGLIYADYVEIWIDLEPGTPGTIFKAADPQFFVKVAIAIDNFHVHFLEKWEDKLTTHKNMIFK